MESRSVSPKPKQLPREVDTRCREIIDAFDLHPVKFRERSSFRDELPCRLLRSPVADLV